MKTRLLQSLLAASALALLGGCDSEQQPTTCRAAGGGTPFAAKFVPVGAPATGTRCFEPGRLLNLGSYDPPGADLPTLAIGVEQTVAYPVAPDAQAGQVRLATGTFTTKVAGANNICSVPTLTPIVNTIPVTPANTLSGAGKTYTFSNAELYVSAANQGTQLKADLVIAANDGSCSASYKVVGLYPEVMCSPERGETPEVCTSPNAINPDLVTAGEVVCDTSIVYANPFFGLPGEVARVSGVCVLKGNDFVKTGGDQ